MEVLCKITVKSMNNVGIGMIFLSKTQKSRETLKNNTDKFNYINV